MKALILAMGFISCFASAHSMQPTIKKYTISDITQEKVMLMNSSGKPQCYNVFIDGMPAFRPKVCLGVDKREYINVLVHTPANEKKITKVCTELVENTKRTTQRFQLCTQIVTYFPQKQLQSALLP